MGKRVSIKAEDVSNNRPPSVIINHCGSRVTRKVPRAAALKATPAMVAAYGDRCREAADVQTQSDKVKLARVNELRRTAAAKRERDKQLSQNAETIVMREGGRSRSVKKRLTTLDRMLKSGQLPKYLRSAVDALALATANATGAATVDGEDSTNRLTAAYEPTTGGFSFGSKTLTDKTINGSWLARKVRDRIPSELQIVFAQIMGEELGTAPDKSPTLSQIGEGQGYNHKQATAAGAMMVYATCTVIGHCLKEFGSLAGLGSERELLAA